MIGLGSEALTQIPATASAASPLAATTLRRQIRIIAIATPAPAIRMLVVSGIATR